MTSSLKRNILLEITNNQREDIIASLKLRFDCLVEQSKEDVTELIEMLDCVGHSDYIVVKESEHVKQMWLGSSNTLYVNNNATCSRTPVTVIEHEREKIAEVYFWVAIYENGSKRLFNTKREPKPVNVLNGSKLVNLIKYNETI